MFLPRQMKFVGNIIYWIKIYLIFWINIYIILLALLGKATFLMTRNILVWIRKLFKEILSLLGFYHTNTNLIAFPASHLWQKHSFEMAFGTNQNQHPLTSESIINCIWVPSYSYTRNGKDLGSLGRVWVWNVCIDCKRQPENRKKNKRGVFLRLLSACLPFSFAGDFLWFLFILSVSCPT